MLQTQRQPVFLHAIMNFRAIKYIVGLRSRLKHTSKVPCRSILPIDFSLQKYSETGITGRQYNQTWLHCLIINSSTTLLCVLWLWLFVCSSWNIARFLAQHGPHVLNMTLIAVVFTQRFTNYSLSCLLTVKTSRSVHGQLAKIAFRYFCSLNKTRIKKKYFLWLCT